MKNKLTDPLALGAGLGAAIGIVLLDNIAIGVAFGVAIGLAFRDQADEVTHPAETTEE